MGSIEDESRIRELFSRPAYRRGILRGSAGVAAGLGLAGIYSGASAMATDLIFQATDGNHEGSVEGANRDADYVYVGEVTLSKAPMMYRNPLTSGDQNRIDGTPIEINGVAVSWKDSQVKITNPLMVLEDETLFVTRDSTSTTSTFRTTFWLQMQAKLMWAPGIAAISGMKISPQAEIMYTPLNEAQLPTRNVSWMEVKRDQFGQYEPAKVPYALPQPIGLVTPIPRGIVV